MNRNTFRSADSVVSLLLSRQSWIVFFWFYNKCQNVDFRMEFELRPIIRNQLSYSILMELVSYQAVGMTAKNISP